MRSALEIRVRRTLQDRLQAGATIVVAVSGGGDSVALLHLIDRCRKSLDLRLHVAHLDHALRRGSASDRKFVGKLARSLEVEFHSDRRAVADLRRKDESLEEAARRVRRGFLLEIADSCGADWILTAHTLDDQAETILMRWLRGGGPRALSGMAARGPGPFLRPLLEIEGESLRGYLDRRQLPYREDSTNADERFDRNRVRRRVLPFLGLHVNRRAARNLVQSARTVQEDAVYLDRLAETLCDELWKASADALRAEAARMAELDPPLRRRVWVLALRRAGADSRRIGKAHLDALDELAIGGRHRKVDLPGGLCASKDSRRRVTIRWPG